MKSANIEKVDVQKFLSDHISPSPFCERIHLGENFERALGTCMIAHAFTRLGSMPNVDSQMNTSLVDRVALFVQARMPFVELFFATTFRGFLRIISLVGLGILAFIGNTQSKNPAKTLFEKEVVEVGVNFLAGLVAIVGLIYQKWALTIFALAIYTAERLDDKYKQSLTRESIKLLSREKQECMARYLFNNDVNIENDVIRTIFGLATFSQESAS